jgi:hypothetical protein
MNKKERIKKKHSKIKCRKAKKCVQDIKNRFKFWGIMIAYKKPEPIKIVYDDVRFNISNKLPSEYDVMKYKQYTLRKLYDSAKLSREAYYTLKGMNRRRNNDYNVMNCIRKRSPELALEIELYAKTEAPVCTYEVKMDAPTILDHIFIAHV